METDWSLLGDRLAKRYKKLIAFESPEARVMILRGMSLDWIDLEGARTKSFSVFAGEFNRLQLSINLFENLLLGEELRHEHAGNDGFPIDMPRNLFRYPAMNDGRGLTASSFGVEERDRIEKVILESRGSLKLRKDESIVRELIHRLEFLSLFSFFEAFLEQLLGSEIWDGSEPSKQKANATIMRNSLPEAFGFVLDQMERPELRRLVTSLNGTIFNILHFAYLVRNVHTHNLGRTTGYVIEKGLGYGSVVKRDLVDKNGAVLRTEVLPDIEGFPMKALVQGEYIGLSALTLLLRSILLESAYILDAGAGK